MPWVMMVLSSATTGLPAASAWPPGAWMSMKGRAVSGVMLVLHCVSTLMPFLPQSGTRASASANSSQNIRHGTRCFRWSAWRPPCLRAALPAGAAPASMAAIVTPASASPAPVTSATVRGGGGEIENMPSRSKPITRLPPGGDDAAPPSPQRHQPGGDSPAPAPGRADKRGCLARGS